MVRSVKGRKGGGRREDKGKRKKRRKGTGEWKEGKEKKALLMIFHLIHDCKMVLCD